VSFITICRGRVSQVLMVGLVMAIGAPIQPAFTEEGSDPSVEPVTAPTVVVQGTRTYPEGTGTLHLSEQSQGSSRLGLTLREIPASVEVVTQQTMQERGLRTVSEAIQAATGVVVGDHPVAPGAFSMRGFSQNQIRLLFDGLSLGPTGFVTRPRDSWNLDRVEILKGPASVLYGEGAVAGAVNLVTKRPIRELTGSEAFLSYGSFNTLRAGVGSGGTLGTDQLHYRVDLSYQNSDSVYGIQRTPYTYWNMTSAVLYDVTSRFNLELSFDIAHDRAKPYTGTPLVPSSFATQGGQRGREHDGRPNRRCPDAAAELQRARCRHERVDDLDEVESDVAADGLHRVAESSVLLHGEARLDERGNLSV
jgi:iron complex outermembrane receptor protein